MPYIVRITFNRKFMYQTSIGWWYTKKDAKRFSKRDAMARIKKLPTKTFNPSVIEVRR